MRTDLNKLDDTLGVRRVFDVRVVQELQEQHKEDRSTVKRLRGAILSRLFQIVSLLIAGVSAILLVGIFFDITHPTARSTTEQATQSWGHFKGAVPPGLALTVNIALVALVASINIAIAAAAGRLSRREQIISSLWRRMLEWCAIAIAVGAGLFCILQLGSLHKPDEYGTAAGAIFVGGVTAFLAITLAQYLNATDWARDFTDACEQRTNIIDWLEYIQDRGAPATIPAANPFRLKWKWVSKVPRLLATVVVIGFFDVIYTYGVLEIMVFIKKRTLVTPPMGWTHVWFIAAIWAYSSAIAYVIGSSTWRRWYTRIKWWRRFRLTIWPQIYRIGYLVFVALFILALSASQSDEPATWGRILPVSILMAGPFIFVPGLSWFYLWRSRKHADGRKRRLARWLTDPIWQNVSKSLENAYRGQTKRRDESYDCDSTERRAPHLTKQGYAPSAPTLWVPPHDVLESAELILRISRKS